MSAGLSVVIPVWNGQRLLAQNLPSIKEALKRVSVAWELLVVDDGSTDAVDQYLAEVHPDVRLIRNQRNRGFSAAVHDGINAAKYDVLYLLNSDVQLEPDALSVLLAHFNDPQVFAVASLDAEIKPFSIPAFTNRMGLLGVSYVPAAPLSAPTTILFATGGHSAYRASLLREIGYDPLFAPAYWEDIDCCTRAHSRGFKILLEPRSRVHHQPGSTIRRWRSPNTVEGYRAGHRWLFSLRHSPNIGLASLGALLFAHPKGFGQALWVTLARAWRIRRRAEASAPVLKRFSRARIKKEHGQPWKVAYVAGVSDIIGGGEESLLTLLAALDGKSIQPVLITPAEGSLVQRAKALGIPVEPLLLPSSFRGLFDGTLIRLSRWLSRQDVDVVHINTSGRSLLLFGMAARFLGIPVVWHARVANPEPFTDWLGASAASKIIATSRYVSSRFKSRAVLGKIVQIPNPVDLERFTPGHSASDWRKAQHLPLGKTLVGVFGRFDAWKRFDLALESLRRTEAVTSLHLVFVGDGPKRRELELLCKRLGLTESVSFAGWQTQPERAMAAVDIVLHPTPTEHFGRIFIEAMASGKPVIASESGAAAEVVSHGNTGILVRPDDPSAFASALTKLSADPGYRLKIGQAGRRQAESVFDSRRIAERVTKLYEELLIQR